jgi:hypothetical protein
MLERGDLVPHFDVTTLNGDRISYATLWQHANLVLITVASSNSDAGENYLSEVTAAIPRLCARNTTCVITREQVPGVPHPGVVIADKWGEIVYVCAASDLGDLPPVEELAEWLEYVEMQCPECQGEAR